MKQSTVHWLAILTVDLTVLLMAFGAYNRGNDFEGVVLWLAVLIGLFAIMIVIGALRLGLDGRWVVLPSIAAVAAIGVQAWLGWMHANSDSGQDLLLAHLFVSLAIVGLLVIVAVATRAAPDGPNLLERDWSRQLGIGAFAVFIVLMLGSMTKGTDLSGSIYWAHRMASAAVLVYLLFLMWRGAHVERPRKEGYLVIGATVLFVANIALGFSHAWADVQTDWAVAVHLGFGAAIWAALMAATFLSFHDPR